MNAVPNTPRQEHNRPRIKRQKPHEQAGRTPSNGGKHDERDAIPMSESRIGENDRGHEIKTWLADDLCGNRHHQPRLIVLHVPDRRAEPVGFHLLGRIRLEQ